MPLKKTKNNLIIFVKYPERGKVKTRLADEIGDEKATRIYSIISKYIIKKFSNSKDYNTTVFYSPRDRKSEIEDWLKQFSLELFPQNGNTLGERISNAFENIISRGARNVVIIGTDCVHITLEDIDSTFEILNENVPHVVIGPANDGGYYLLGTNIYIKELFSDIDWSTQRVLNQTIEKVNNSKLNYTLKNELSDIDYMKDINIDALKKLDDSMAKKIKSILTSHQ